MKSKDIEWQTLFAVLACYCLWGGSTLAYHPVSENWGEIPAGFMLLSITALVTAFHTSLQHEVVHGHPTPWPLLNEALIFPSLVLVYPFRRYRDLHLTHHIDANLTDPYEDPESYYWSPRDKKHITPLMLRILRLNNTLVGRLVLGPVLGLKGFYRTELARVLLKEKGVRFAWALHVFSCLLVYFWVSVVCQIPFGLYVLLVAYPAISWILIRSFAEHKAAENIGPRTAIVEAHPFFGMLFLNNNLHIIHHAHPEIAWYELPKLYRERKEQYLKANDNLYYPGYGSVFKRYAFRARQPVFHPFHNRRS